MGKIYLLDCTLRDGGYVNDWQFGEETIRGFGRKIAQTTRTNPFFRIRLRLRM